MLGITLKMRRNFLGLTIREVAAGLGVTERTVRNWENMTMDIPGSGSRYMEKQNQDTLSFQSYLRSKPKMKFLLLCSSLEDIHFFYNDIPNVNIAYSVYRHSVISTSIVQSKDLVLINTGMYKKWLQATLANDTMESRQEFMTICGNGEYIIDKKAEGLKDPQLKQLSLI